MKQVNLPLDYIINMANNSEFLNGDVEIAQALINHFHQLKSMNLDSFIFVANLSAKAFKKFYNRLGYQSYTEFKDDLIFSSEVRTKQIIQRYGNYDLDQALCQINLYATEPFSSLDLIDKICDLIFQAPRVLCFGAAGQTTLLHDFQLDLLLMKKQVRVSSLLNLQQEKPDPDDLIFLFSASGRIFYLAPTKFKEDVYATANIKVLFCQEPVTTPENTLILATKAHDDYFANKFVIGHYLDLIRIRYFHRYGHEVLDDHR